MANYRHGATYGSLAYDLDALARENGFSRWGELNMDALVPLDAVREMCAADRCGCYGRNWACPPEFPVCVCGKKPRVRLVTRKPIVSGAAELEENSRARSAKLRVAEKV